MAFHSALANRVTSAYLAPARESLIRSRDASVKRTSAERARRTSCFSRPARATRLPSTLPQFTLPDPSGERTDIGSLFTPFEFG
eukprot:scaffold16087_cov112-Isochrysis_galbana.AAC.3